MSDPEFYWEDFVPGETREFGEKHVTREEIIDFAKDYDPQPFHLDEKAGKESILGGLCASGWHSCAMLMRMLCDGFLLKSAALGAPGLEEVRWQKPVYVDDVLHVRQTCLESRVSRSRPEMGLVKFQSEVLNQKDEVCMISTGWMMMALRNPMTRESA